MIWVLKMGKIPKHWYDSISYRKIGKCEWCGMFASLRPVFSQSEHKVYWMCERCVDNERRKFGGVIYAKRKY